jgi:hypothetical protein
MIGIKALALLTVGFLALLSALNTTWAADPPVAATGETTEVTKGHTGKTTELIVRDKSGQITQWYQRFYDYDGKELVTIIKMPTGTNKALIHYCYKENGDVLEVSEFYGNRELRRRVVHQYSQDGTWIRGVVYGGDGRRQGEEKTPPDEHLYHGKRRATKSP